MLSPRLSAQLGLTAAAVVLASSMTILIVGGRERPRTPQATAAVHVQPLLAAPAPQIALGEDHK